MKNITCCLSILSGLLLQSCDITRMETPAYKTDRASTRTYENLIFYEVLTDGQQFVDEVGYVGLSEEEINTELSKFQDQ